MPLLPPVIIATLPSSVGMASSFCCAEDVQWAGGPANYPRGKRTGALCSATIKMAAALPRQKCSRRLIRCLT